MGSSSMVLYRSTGDRISQALCFLARYIYIWFWPSKTSFFSAFKAVLFNRWQVRMMMEYVWGRAMAGFNGESPEELSLNRLSVESQSF
jgi:hypothetical protein